MVAYADDVVKQSVAKFIEIISKILYNIHELQIIEFKQSSFFLQDEKLYLNSPNQGADSEKRTENLY